MFRSCPRQHGGGRQSALVDPPCPPATHGRIRPVHDLMLQGLSSRPQLKSVLYLTRAAQVPVCLASGSVYIAYMNVLHE